MSDSFPYLRLGAAPRVCDACRPLKRRCKHRAATDPTDRSPPKSPLSSRGNVPAKSADARATPTDSDAIYRRTYVTGSADRRAKKRKRPPGDGSDTDYSIPSEDERELRGARKNGNDVDSRPAKSRHEDRKHRKKSPDIYDSIVLKAPPPRLLPRPQPQPLPPPPPLPPLEPEPEPEPGPARQATPPPPLLMAGGRRMSKRIAQASPESEQLSPTILTPPQPRRRASSTPKASKAPKGVPRAGSISITPPPPPSKSSEHVSLQEMIVEDVEGVGGNDEIEQINEVEGGGPHADGGPAIEQGHDVKLEQDIEPTAPDLLPLLGTRGAKPAARKGIRSQLSGGPQSRKVDAIEREKTHPAPESEAIHLDISATSDAPPPYAPNPPTVPAVPAAPRQSKPPESLETVSPVLESQLPPALTPHPSTPLAPPHPLNFCGKTRPSFRQSKTSSNHHLLSYPTSSHHSSTTSRPSSTRTPLLPAPRLAYRTPINQTTIATHSSPLTTSSEKRLDTIRRWKDPTRSARFSGPMKVTALFESPPDHCLGLGVSAAWDEDAQRSRGSPEL